MGTISCGTSTKPSELTGIEPISSRKTLPLTQQVIRWPLVCPAGIGCGKNPSSREAAQNLHGDVIVVGYSWALQEPQGLTMESPEKGTRAADWGGRQSKRPITATRPPRPAGDIVRLRRYLRLRHHRTP